MKSKKNLNNITDNINEIIHPQDGIGNGGIIGALEDEAENTVESILHIDGTEVDLTLPLDEILKVMEEKYLEYGNTIIDNFEGSGEVKLIDKDWDDNYYCQYDETLIIRGEMQKALSLDDVNLIPRDLLVYQPMQKYWYNNTGIVYRKSPKGQNINQTLYFREKTKRECMISFLSAFNFVLNIKTEIENQKPEFKGKLSSVLNQIRVTEAEKSVTAEDLKEFNREQIKIYKEKFDIVIEDTRQALNDIKFETKYFDVDKWLVKPVKL